MSARGLLAGLALAGCAPADAPVSPPAPAQVARPFTGAALAAACRDRDGWSDPAPPARVHANVYLVGTCGIVALLVTSDAGHVLIDGATDRAAAGIADNIARLGFRASDVRILLNGHEHNDHAGGLAELRRLTGAQLRVRAPARAAIETGRAQPGDPQLGLNDPFPGTPVDGTVADGDVVRVGPIALTAHATPGHTPGSTSWSWRSCDGARCLDFVYADSLTAYAADDYRYSDHPEVVAAFRAAIDRVAGLPCDVLITPHPGASDLYPRLAGSAPLVDRGACARYADAARQRLAARLATEAQARAR